MWWRKSSMQQAFGSESPGVLQLGSGAVRHLAFPRWSHSRMISAKKQHRMLRWSFLRDQKSRTSGCISRSVRRQLISFQFTLSRHCATCPGTKEHGWKNECPPKRWIRGFRRNAETSQRQVGAIASWCHIPDNFVSLMHEVRLCGATTPPVSWCRLPSWKFSC